VECVILIAPMPGMGVDSPAEVDPSSRGSKPMTSVGTPDRASCAPCLLASPNASS